MLMILPYIALVILLVISELNKALEELLYWCKTNSLVPHPKKCEAMILHRGRFTGPLKELTLAQDTIKWVTHSRLLGVLIDDQLNWSKHVSVVKKGFVDKLNLLKRSRLSKEYVIRLILELLCHRSYMVYQYGEASQIRKVLRH